MLRISQSDTTHDVDLVVDAELVENSHNAARTGRRCHAMDENSHVEAL